MDVSERASDDQGFGVAGTPHLHSTSNTQLHSHYKSTQHLVLESDNYPNHNKYDATLCDSSVRKGKYLCKQAVHFVGLKLHSGQCVAQTAIVILTRAALTARMRGRKRYEGIRVKALSMIASPETDGVHRYLAFTVVAVNFIRPQCSGLDINSGLTLGEL